MSKQRALLIPDKCVGHCHMASHRKCMHHDCNELRNALHLHLKCVFCSSPLVVPCLQIRASPCTAPPGNTFWSAPVQLDALGAAAVVLVPAAMAARDATTTDADSAIVVSVTAVEVLLL